VPLRLFLSHFLLLAPPVSHMLVLCVPLVLCVLLSLRALLGLTHAPPLTSPTARIIQGASTTAGVGCFIAVPRNSRRQHPRTNCLFRPLRCHPLHSHAQASLGQAHIPHRVPLLLCLRPLTSPTARIILQLWASKTTRSGGLWRPKINPKINS